MKNKQRGDILILTLAMLLVFVVILAAWSRFAALQRHVVADQEQEEVAFGMAEAGIRHTLFALNSGEIGPDELENQTGQQVTDPRNGALVGSYDIEFVGDTVPLEVTSVGRGGGAEECQTVDAVIDSLEGAVGGTQYYVSEFNHRSGNDCEEVLVFVEGVTILLQGPTVVFEKDPPPGVSPEVFTISLLGGPAGLPIEVIFSTKNGSATAPGDYTATTQTVRFDPGETSKTVPVDIVADHQSETFLEYFDSRISDANANIQGSGTNRTWIIDWFD
jgi:hypothetical protein